MSDRVGDCAVKSALCDLRAAGSKARSAIRSAIATYHRETCIRFVVRRRQKDYIRFYSEDG